MPTSPSTAISLITGLSTSRLSSDPRTCSLQSTISWRVPSRYSEVFLSANVPPQAASGDSLRMFASLGTAFGTSQSPTTEHPQSFDPPPRRYRLAHLIDAISIPQQSLDAVSGVLTQIFRDLVVLTTSDFTQTFVVNSKVAAETRTENWTQVVELSASGPPRLNLARPPSVDTILDKVVSTTQTVGTLPELTPVQLIALAGFLLEYPFAYLPCSDDLGSTLAGVELKVFTCFFISDGNRHQLMKFSCPAFLPSDACAAAIATKWNRRLQEKGFTSYSVEVVVAVVSLDRVAL